MPRLVWVLGLLVAVLCLQPGTQAYAAESSSDAKAIAEKSIEQAQALLKERKYAEAGDQLQASYRANPDPVVLFNAGQAYRKALRPIEARAAYQKLVDEHPSHQLAQEAKGYIQTLDVLIQEMNEKQKIEMALLEQKEASERDLLSERQRREQSERELSKYKKPVHKRAWFWVGVGAAVLVLGGVGLAIWADKYNEITVGGTHTFKFSY